MGGGRFANFFRFKNTTFRVQIITAEVNITSGRAYMFLLLSPRLLAVSDEDVDGSLNRSTCPGFGQPDRHSTRPATLQATVPTCLQNNLLYLPSAGEPLGTNDQS